MADLTFYDAAWPPANPPVTDGVCLYIGGDTPHVWTAEEIGMQPARYRLPIFVRSNPPGPGPAADVAAALARLKAIGAPRGTLVAWDMETAADAPYIRAVSAGLTAGGYKLIIYGSESMVRGNDVPDGLYFGADWTNVPHLHPGDAMTQYVSFSGFDEELARSSLPFWDTRPAPPAPVPSWQEAMMQTLPVISTSQNADDAHNARWFVHRIQAILAAVFALPVKADGVYGPATAAAVAAVQRKYGLTADSIVGPATWPLILAGEHS